VYKSVLLEGDLAIKMHILSKIISQNLHNLICKDYGVNAHTCAGTGQQACDWEQKSANEPREAKVFMPATGRAVQGSDQRGHPYALASCQLF